MIVSSFPNSAPETRSAGSARQALLFSWLPLLLAALVLTACERGTDEMDLPAAPQPTVTKNETLTASLSLLDSGAAGITGSGDAAVIASPTDIAVEAKGNDPQLILPPLQAPGNSVALRIAIEAPADTTLELYFQTKSAPQFSAEKVIGAPLKQGQNNLLIRLEDPQFNGQLRLDPGQSPGRYVVTALEVFAAKPLQIARVTRSQEELAAAFERLPGVLFSASTPAELHSIQPGKEVVIRMEAGLTAVASGTDPSLLLPELPGAGVPALAHITITSPAQTTLQMFYLKKGQSEYVESQTASCELKAGRNAVLLELPEAGWTGRLRIDPGMVPGEYTIENVVIKAASQPAP